MNEHEILWVSPFEDGTIDDPPIKAQQIFENDGLLYKRISFNESRWDDFTIILNKFFPDLLDYLKNSDYNYKFEVKLEFKDTEDQWVYALYIQFDNVSEFVHFMMWYKSQIYVGKNV